MLGFFKIIITYFTTPSPNTFSPVKPTTPDESLQHEIKKLSLSVSKLQYFLISPQILSFLFRTKILLSSVSQ